MSADPKRKSRQHDDDQVKYARRHQEEVLDDALKNTFPASDPVSIMISEQKSVAEVLLAHRSSQTLSGRDRH